MYNILIIIILFPIILALLAFIQGIIMLIKIEQETKAYRKEHYKATKLE